MTISTRTPRFLWNRRVLAAALTAALLLVSADPVHAKLSGPDWKQLQTDYQFYFGQRGNPVEKSAVMRRLLEDGESRAYKLVGDGLVLECRAVWELRVKLQETTSEHAKYMAKRFTGNKVKDEVEMQRLQKDLAQIELEIKVEKEALNAVLDAVEKAPEALRSNLLKRAKSSKDWTYRAAAARLAVRNIEEKDAKAHLQRLFSGEKDPRVRSAALGAIGDLSEGLWEDWTIGRLGDPHWAVRLQAVDLIHYRNLKRAVPHLINALADATPRLADAIGSTLTEFTGQKIEPYADVWALWWVDNKKTFLAERGESDDGAKVKAGGKRNKFDVVHFYGLPIKSDRVMFIIDVSSSMLKKTVNENPRDKWKPPPTTTGGDAPPPPPPPPEILSGPKIDVAKHELKKAIQGLPKDATFNIIAFSNAAMAWQSKMVKADDKNKAEALKWVRALKAKSVTYVDGALRLAFKIAGLIDVQASVPEITVDTIVLMSDGAPTDNSNRKPKLMDTELILGHVREWNAAKRVKIHCIGVDIQPHIVFLKKLADQNGGTYLDR